MSKLLIIDPLIAWLFARLDVGLTLDHLPNMFSRARPMFVCDPLDEFAQVQIISLRLHMGYHGKSDSPDKERACEKTYEAERVVFNYQQPEPFTYRGQEVAERIVELGMGELVARLDPVYGLKP